MNRLFGFIGDIPCRDIIIGGISSMSGEYEMCGISMKEDGELRHLKIKGSSQELLRKADGFCDKSTAGLAQCADAYRLSASVITAPPASDGEYSVALDGYIENSDTLRERAGVCATAVTDAELLLEMIKADGCENRCDTIKKLNASLGGNPGYAFISAAENALYAKAGSTELAVGICTRGYCVSSELGALLPFAKKYFILKSGETVRLTPDRAYAFDAGMRKIKKQFRTVPDRDGVFRLPSQDSIYRCPSEIKEIYSRAVCGSELNFDYLKLGKRALSGISRIIIAGGDGAYEAARLGAYHIEMLCDIPCLAIQTGELRYSGTYFDRSTLLIILSGSGEEYDAVACARRVKPFDTRTLALTANGNSCLARLCKDVILTPYADGVCAFEVYALMLTLLALHIGSREGIIHELYLSVALKMAELLPGKISAAFKLNATEKPARTLIGAQRIITAGTGADCFAAAEAAHGIKRITGIPAQSVPLENTEEADSDTAVLALISSRELLSSALIRLRRMKARGAEILIFTTANLEEEIRDFPNIITVPDSLPLFDCITCLCAVLRCADTARLIKEKDACEQAAG